jgi:calcineurin-like phosphoesterase family protein
MYELKDPERTWITSDTHAFHKNICKGCTQWTDDGATRDFFDASLMTAVMADNFNKVVRPDDILFHLGDWSFGGRDKVKIFREMINCKNIILVIGNHDHHIERERNEELGNLFTYIHGSMNNPQYITIKVGGHTYVCGHYAMLVWNESHRHPNHTRHLYGHSHGSLPDNPNSLSFDIGVDCHDLKPLNFIQVDEIMKKKVWKPVDHHDKETN